ncbi:MAG: class I adenylate cyclase [Planctomycetes bacterium]|nr:class I adenylate cyclase [Planctomycetota bacterium]
MTLFYERPSLEESKSILDRNYYTFVHFNRQRKHVMKTLCDPRRYELLQLVAMLLHVNDRRAPGYVADLGGNPGLHGFTLNDDLRDLRKKYLSNKFVISVGQSENPLCVSLASIGSAGTLAQTEKSDFDLWLTLRSDVKAINYHHMRQKADMIIEFLMSIDPELDMNIYLGTPAKIRNHDFGAVSDDSAGSALGKLLKEEFYRTCINWCGQVPIWWVLPHDVRDHDDYEWWVQRIQELAPPYLEDLMDLGPVERASNEALLASVLWQTNKSLASPFKSLMKLTVVTRYHAEPNERDSLADRVRRNVQVNPTHGRGTDAYLCLFDFCAQYWRNERNDDAVSLMAEMFFLKMLTESASRFSVQKADETLFRKRSEVRTLLHGWGLNQKQTRDLSNINNWSFEKSMKYRARTQRFVKFIFDRVMLNLEKIGLKLDNGEVIKLNPDVDDAAVALLSEFSTISHKVDAYYGRSWLKVQPSPPGFRKMLHQQGYAIVGRDDCPKHVQWTLSEEVPVFERKGPGEKKGDTAPTQMQETYEEGTNAETLVQSRTPLHILVWLACNKLLKKRSMLRVIAGGTRRAAADVRRFVLKIADFFEHPLYDDKFAESEFNIPPVPAKAILYFDIQQSGMFRFHKTALERQEEGASSETSLILKRGTIKRMTYAEQSTHGIVKVYDVPVERFSIAAMVARLMRILDGKRRSVIDDYVMLEAANTKMHEDWIKDFRNEIERIHGLVTSVPARPKSALRIITKLNDKYAMFTRIGLDKYRGVELGTVQEVLAALDEPLNMPVQTIVDESAEGLERLRTMMGMWAPGQVRIFIHQRAQVSSIHVIDEAGGFYNERVPTERIDLETASIRAFVHALRNAQRPFMAGGGRPPMAIFRLRNELAQQGFYHYTAEPLGGRDERNLDRQPILKVAIDGTDATAGPIKITTLTASGQQHFFELSGESWRAQLAVLLAQIMERQRLVHFSIARIAFESGPKPRLQTLAYLHQRRRLEAVLHAAMGAYRKAQSEKRAADTRMIENMARQESGEIPVS